MKQGNEKRRKKKTWPGNPGQIVNNEKRETKNIIKISNFFREEQLYSISQDLGTSPFYFQPKYSVFGRFRVVILKLILLQLLIFFTIRHTFRCGFSLQEIHM